MILRDRGANTAWEDQTDGTLEERTYYCQNWRADVVALMTDAGQLVHSVRYDPYGVPFGIPKTDMDGDGDADTDDYTLYYSYYTGSTMPFADWNWDGTKNSTDLIAYGNDRTADSTLGRGMLGYAYSHAGGASHKGYAGYEVDPVLTGSEGWESIWHVRHRVLLSQLGRWTRRDPLGYMDGISLYQYDTPLIGLDPQGLRKEACSGGLCDSDPGDDIDWHDSWLDCMFSDNLNVCIACCEGKNDSSGCIADCISHFKKPGSGGPGQNPDPPPAPTPSPLPRRDDYSYPCDDSDGCKSGDEPHIVGLSCPGGPNTEHCQCKHCPDGERDVYHVKSIRVGGKWCSLTWTTCSGAPSFYHPGQRGSD